MKLNKWFIIGIVLFVVLVFTMEWRAPRHFVWNPTYGHKDANPFGCMVFDSLMSRSLPGGYRVSDQTLYQLAYQENPAPCGILISGLETPLTQTDVQSLQTLLRRGCFVIMPPESNARGLLADTFGVSMSYYDSRAFDITPYQRQMGNAESAVDTMLWLKDDRFAPCFYSIYHDFIILSMLNDTTLNDTVSMVRNIEDNDTTCYLTALARPYGQGKIFFTATPLLFTNFGVMDNHTTGYVGRMMSQFGDLPVVRTTGYLKAQYKEEASPFRYLLSQPPLRWSFYLLLAGVALFMLFTARRRQRVIPVVEPPANVSLDFVKLVGTLYYHRKDNRALVKQAYVCFAETLRRELLIDIDDEARDDIHAGDIAARTGLDATTVEQWLQSVRRCLHAERQLSDGEMEEAIDKMNQLMRPGDAGRSQTNTSWKNKEQTSALSLTK